MNALIILFFLIPAIADILFMIPLLMGFFGITPPLWNIPYYPMAIVTGVVVGIVQYLLLILSMIHYLVGRRARFLSFSDRILSRYRKPITISVILSLSTFMVLFLPQAFPRSFAASDFYMSSGMVFLIKLLLIGILWGGVTYIRPSKVLMGMSAIVITTVTGLLIMAMVAIIQELMPSYYLTFPLNDARAQYVMNYDGDYWITYYEVKRDCDGSTCHDELIKKGNTAITESPVPLEPYRDKAVRVTGTFEAINGPKNGTAKKLCIGSGIQKQCHESTGPGMWYASPLKITTIRLDGN